MELGELIPIGCVHLSPLKAMEVLFLEISYTWYFLHFKYAAKFIIHMQMLKDFANKMVKCHVLKDLTVSLQHQGSLWQIQIPYVNHGILLN